MANTLIKKKNHLITAGLLLSFFISFYLMSHATQASSRFNELFTSLLLVNIIATVLLFALLVKNLLWLRQQFKKKVIGSRITLKVVLLFFAISSIPTAVVFYFSNQLLHQSVDSWFDVHIDEAMQNSLTLSQRSFDNKTRSAMRETRQLAEVLENESDIFLSLTLASLREVSSAAELTAFSKQGRIIASTNVDPGVLIPSTPDDAILLLLRQSGEFIGIEPSDNGNIIIRALVEIKASNPKRYLQAIYPVQEGFSELANTVENAYTAYQEFNFLRQSLKSSFTLTLFLVLIFTLLIASWAAFVFARELVEPVRQLVKGTKAVAAGDYENKLPVGPHDELGFLVNSFNEMTSKISATRLTARNAQRDAENQHAYLATILRHLSNGVLGFDLSFRLMTANQGANQILGQDLAPCINLSLEALSLKHPNLEKFCLFINQSFAAKASEWQHEFTFQIQQQKRTLLLKGAPLFAADDSQSGYILIFDDVTPIIQSQRNAAWSEVAQRLAHEIKNPLTPIQLSAERLQRKLHGQLDAASDQLLKKSTNTIIHQVSAMKSMVDDFSDFAKPAKFSPKRIAIGELIEEVSLLYQGQIKRLNTHLDPNLPTIFADPIRLRQVLINLIKNAQEAVNDVDSGRIDISINYLPNKQSIKICIADNGPGVDNSDLEHIFEPYVTSKVHGTGLGLAIVKKIIDEHGGTISIEPVQPQGANFTIHLPVLTNKTQQPDGSTL